MSKARAARLKERRKVQQVRLDPLQRGYIKVIADAYFEGNQSDAVRMMIDFALREMSEKAIHAERQREAKLRAAGLEGTRAFGTGPSAEEV
jgi:hypothetical protein